MPSSRLRDRHTHLGYYAAQRRTALRLVREFPQLNNYSQKFVARSSAHRSPVAQPDVNNPQLNR